MTYTIEYSDERAGGQYVDEAAVMMALRAAGDGTVEEWHPGDCEPDCDTRHRHYHLGQHEGCLDAVVIS